MDITPVLPSGRKIIDRYGESGFVISGVKYGGNILIMPEQVLAWPVDNLDSVTLQSFTPVLQLLPKTDLLIIGTGKGSKLIPEETRIALKKENITIEVMDTKAACRTYNILLAEGRRVAAALMALS